MTESIPFYRGGNLARLLVHMAGQRGDHPAIEEADGVASYRALSARAARIARGLTRAGVRPGDGVAIFLERGVDGAAAYFATLAVGAVAVVVNERFRPRQVEYVARHAGASVLLVSAEMLSRQPHAIETDATLLEIEGIGPGEEALEPASRVAGDVAQIIYTSGSTGQPKGVTFSHGNLWAGVDCVASYLGLRPDDRVASLLPFSSVYGLNQLISTLSVGGTLVVESSPLAQQIVTRARENALTVIAAVPPLWMELLRVPAFCAEPIPSLRLLQNAGGHLPVPAVRALRAAQPHADLVLNYGQTETFRGTFLPPEEVDRRPNSMGRAVPGAEIFVVREDGSRCDPGEIGELVHRGATVALGYWNDPQSSDAVFRPNPFRLPGAPEGERVVFSGDLVREDEAGFLEYVGRRDRVVKSLGYRVGPDEVMDVLFASGEITEGVVTAEPDEQRGQRLVAHVVLKGGGSIRRLELFCRAEMPRYMQPARFSVRGELPRTAAGKYDLLAL